MTDYKFLHAKGQELANFFEFNFEAYEFLPCHKFGDFLSKDAVEKALQAAGFNDTTELVNYILPKAKRLFLILLLMSKRKEEKLSSLKDFREENITDASLPDPRKRFPLEWEKQDCVLFYIYQRAVTAPEFGNGSFRLKLHPQTVLPYLSYPPPSGGGFFGQVSRVEIHPAHVPALNVPHGGKPVPIAVKTVTPHEEASKFFEKEATALDRLKDHNSPNLVQPIAAYERNNEKCLIFPWADGGDLHKFWETCRGEEVSLKWIVDQFTGICSVLKDLHQINCRHGDLKPENILWFKDEAGLGNLQIADLGLAAFHMKDTGNRKGIHTTTPAGTARYEPPETYGEDKNKERSRAYDIWSMGCIILELLIWLTRGLGAVEDLEITTVYFWKIDDQTRTFQIHPDVEARMGELLADKAFQANKTYKDLLNLVRTGLLVIPLSSERGDAAHRQDAEKLYERMLEIQGECEGNAHLRPIHGDSSKNADVRKRQKQQEVRKQERSKAKC